jgi:hypothetical protein
VKLGFELSPLLDTLVIAKEIRLEVTNILAVVASVHYVGKIVIETQQE